MTNLELFSLANGIWLALDIEEWQQECLDVHNSWKYYYACFMGTYAY